MCLQLTVRKVFFMRTHTSSPQTDVASVAFGIAASAGLLHAVASLYWAVGGRWQLESVGEWAVELARESPVEIGLALGLIALVKRSQLSCRWSTSDERAGSIDRFDGVGGQAVSFWWCREGSRRCRRARCSPASSRPAMDTTGPP